MRPARPRPRPDAGARLEPDQREHGVDAPPDLGRRPALHAQAEADIAAHGEMREQRVILEHGVDRAAVRGIVGDVASVQQDAAAVRTLEAGHQAQGRALAATGRSEQGQELALAQAEIELLHDEAGAAIALADLVQSHDLGRCGGLAQSVASAMAERRLADPASGVNGCAGAETMGEMGGKVRSPRRVPVPRHRRHFAASC